MPSKFKAGHDARIRGEDRRQGNEWNLMGLLSVELNISICKTFFEKLYKVVHNFLTRKASFSCA